MCSASWFAKNNLTSENIINKSRTSEIIKLDFVLPIKFFKTNQIAAISEIEKMRGKTISWIGISRRLYWYKNNMGIKEIRNGWIGIERAVVDMFDMKIII